MPTPYKTEMAIADNVLVYMHYFLKKGEEMGDHAHVFDHITLLARGSVSMVHDNGSKEYSLNYLKQPKSLNLIWRNEANTKPTSKNIV